MDYFYLSQQCVVHWRTNTSVYSCDQHEAKQGKVNVYHYQGSTSAGPELELRLPLSGLASSLCWWPFKNTIVSFPFYKMGAFGTWQRDIHKPRLN